MFSFSFQNTLLITIWLINDIKFVKCWRTKQYVPVRFGIIAGGGELTINYQVRRSTHTVRHQNWLTKVSTSFTGTVYLDKSEFQSTSTSPPSRSDPVSLCSDVGINVEMELFKLSRNYII